MSKASTPPNQPASSATTPNTSAWSRGPPAAASNQSSAVPSAVSTPPNGATANDQLTGSTPVSIGGNPKWGNLMVGGTADFQPRGNLAFGTVDSPNLLLSSSPAAPAATGSHLADAVKSFGSIDAETTATGAAMIRPPRRTSGGAASAAPSGLPQQKKLDVHSLFAGKPHPQPSAASGSASPSQVPQAGSPIQDRRQSIPHGSFPGANGLPGPAPHQYQPMSGLPGQAHLRPPQGIPGQPRSPVMGAAQPQFPGQVPPQQAYRVPQPQMQGNQQPVRPGGVNGPMGVARPLMGQQAPYGIPHGQGQAYPIMYPGQGGYFYPHYEQPYGMAQQWPPQQQQQQHPSNIPLSPRAAQAQLGGSPAPPSANLPGSAGGSSMPTPPSRPQSLVGGHQSTPSNTSVSPLPTTPSRPLQPGTPFTPQVTASAQGAQTPTLSAGAMSFTPRAKSAVKFSRPDGTTVDIAEAAAAAKGPTSSGASGAATPETTVEEPPKKKLPVLPAIVRLESEEQKKTRLAEEEKRKKIQEQEEKEEQERKERVERRAKEERERKAKEEAEAKELEAAKEKAKQEEEQKAKEQKAKEEELKQAKNDAPAEEPKSVDPKPEAPKEPEVASKAAEKQAPEPVEEPSRALLTPTTQSAVASPLSSPALAAAGLPAKPLSAINGGRRSTPSSLDLKSSPAPSAAAGATTTPSTPSALGTAKPIEDLASVEYPESVKPQNANLNANSEPGKFRYDRDFLMQFMDVCKERPESLPPLEEIGLEADSSNGFGRRQGSRSSLPPANRGAMGGIGGSNIGGRGFANTMGSFGFASGTSIRNTTSEERYKLSLMQPGAGGRSMSRTASQGGGLPHMAPSNSRAGSKRERVKRPAPVVNDPDVAPLAVTANAWVNARSAGSDESSPVYIERKVKALLNKLTEEKFDSISTQILEWANKSSQETDGMTLKLVIKLVFEKSTDEAHWSAMYAKLCRLLLDRLDPNVSEVIDGKQVSGGSLFRKYLLGRCQADFEAGWKAREDAARLAASKSEEDKAKAAEAAEVKDGGEAPMMSDEYYAAQKAKRRGLGLVQLIGELYKLEMLSKNVIRECLVRLLGNVENPDEEDLESTCKLLTTVGKQFDAASTKSMDTVFERLEILLKNEAVSSRIRFMIMDVVDLRKHKWQSRKEVVPTTIAQIHQQAARENAEKAQAARESISRGGSRAGHSRREAPQQPGEWQSVGGAGSARPPPQRPTDFSQIGRGVSSAGLPSAPTFGPSGVFARNKKGGTAGSTPPLSRHSSTTNMFGVLNESSDGAAPSGADAADAPQRRKLNLAPRTKPLPADDDGKDDGEQASDDAEEAEGDAAAPSMTEEEAKQKIGRDVKELWGEKDAGGSRDPEDIVEYYRALPSEFRYLLSEKLSEDVFRIAKIRDADVVARGWAAALKNEVASAEDLEKGVAARMPTLDDDSIDFPQAFKAIAILMRGLSLEQEAIDALVEKIDVYGEPRITPKMKLERAFTALDEEAAAA